MTAARDEILGKLRAALTDPHDAFRAPAGRFAAPAPTLPVKEARGTRWEMARSFRAELERVQGHCDIVPRHALPDHVVTQLISWGAGPGTTLLSWAPTELPLPNVVEHLATHYITAFVPEDLHDEECRDLAAHTGAGLTSAHAAIASTGSLVLLPGPGRSRAASLLPLHHLALVPFSRLYPSIEAWVAAHRGDGQLDATLRDSAQVVVVTGPSKSADIELQLTLGVHGPREVRVVLFDDEEEDGREGDAPRRG